MRWWIEVVGLAAGRLGAGEDLLGGYICWLPEAIMLSLSYDTLLAHYFALFVRLDSAQASANAAFHISNFASQKTKIE